jgi:PhnB protein
MADETALTYPAISPYLYYQDGTAALAFLAKAFGFEERMRQTDDDGTIRHAEMDVGGGVIMLGCPEDHRSPKELGQVTVGMYVHIDDVDAHFDRAKAAGADVEGPPEDKPYGDRVYGAFDPEGHQWWFAQSIG